MVNFIWYEAKVDSHASRGYSREFGPREYRVPSAIRLETPSMDSRIVDLKTQIAHRYVFELRYDFGFLCWDRAGRIASELASKEGWELASIDFNRCLLQNRDQNIRFSFGYAKLDLTQNQSNELQDLMSPHEFGALAHEFAATVAEALDQPFCTRMGFRVWRLFGTSDRIDAERRVRNLRWLSFQDGMDEQLGAISEASFRAVFVREDKLVRVAVAPFEQQVDLPASVVQAARERARDYKKGQHQVALAKLRAEKTIESYPHFGVLLDMDAYIEDPPFPTPLSASDFVSKATEDFDKMQPVVLAGNESGE